MYQRTFEVRLKNAGAVCLSNQLVWSILKLVCSIQNQDILWERQAHEDSLVGGRNKLHSLYWVQS